MDPLKDWNETNLSDICISQTHPKRIWWKITLRSDRIIQLTTRVYLNILKMDEHGDLEKLNTILCYFWVGCLSNININWALVRSGFHKGWQRSLVKYWCLFSQCEPGFKWIYPKHYTNTYPTAVEKGLLAFYHIYNNRDFCALLYPVSMWAVYTSLLWGSLHLVSR